MIRFRLTLPLQSIFFLLCLLFLGACGTAQQQDTNVLGDYAWSNPEVRRLPTSLTEVSGISMLQGDGDCMVAVQDEDGIVFKISSKGEILSQQKFGKKGDYEDLTYLRDRLVVLRSDGALLAIKDDNSEIKAQKGLVPDGEYEGLYGDSLSNMVYILCKNCKVDKKKDHVTVYGLEMNDQGQFSKVSTVEISLKDPSTGKGYFKKAFQPSALARHPITGQFYLLSSINLAVVITDAAWKIQQVLPLERSVFHQPEGMIFDGEGNLYISNEGEKGLRGNVLFFEKK